LREDAAAAKFVLKQGSTGKYRFNLVATNGQVIATSEAYESKASALKGIESVNAMHLVPKSTTRPRANRPVLEGSSAALRPAAGLGEHAARS
jgi:uncharacterized protein YegP (UPF0339 family)